VAEETGSVVIMPEAADDGLEELRAKVRADPASAAAYADATRRRSFLEGMGLMRKGAGLKQKFLAAKMGTTQSSVSQLESGRVDPHVRTLQRFARACGRRFDFALVDENLPVFDEELARDLWRRVETNMLSPLLTTIATGPKHERTLDSLSRIVGFPPSVVGPILTSLQARGWVASAPNKAGMEVFSPSDKAAYTIGVSVERDRIVGVLMDLHTNVVTSLTSHLRSTGRVTVLAAAVDVVAHLYEARGLHEILGVGVSIAGVVSADTGTVRFAPDLHSAKTPWIDVPLEGDLQDAVQRRVGDKRLLVAVENDANCLAVHEYLKHRPHSVTAVLLSGAGIGVGYVTEGHIVHGAHSAAGEGGHVIMDPGGRPCRAGFPHVGCLETVASARAILETLGLIQQPPSSEGQAPVPMSSSDLEKGLTSANSLVERQDKDATEAFRHAGEMVGWFLATTTALIDPARVVLYGQRELTEPYQYASAKVFQDGFGETIGVENLKRLELDWKTLEEDTEAVAAGAAATRHFLKDPSHWQPAVLAPRSTSGALSLSAERETDPVLENSALVAWAHI
jgi:predicted NBD/HSP70 family sugar kinase/transcriptional regulator with XRE-family HTH domain